MHHGAYYLAANSDDVLGTSVQFLQEHPSETILMRVKQEHEPVDNTRSFAATFEYYRNQAAYTQFIWRGTTLPTLQQVRGKIVILDDFSGGWYGINWGSLDIQDAYAESNTEAKWVLVRDQLARANANDSSRLYVNFCQGGFTPVYNATYGLFGDWSGARFFSTGDSNGDGRTDWSWYAPWSQDFIVMHSNGQGGFFPAYTPWNYPGMP